MHRKQEADELIGVFYKEARLSTLKEMKMFNDVSVNIMSHR